MDDTEITDLPLENLCLSGIGSEDLGLGWLWRCSTRLRKLQLRSCEGIGDRGDFSSFVKCLKGLQEIELRACRTIVDGLLLKFAENCVSLNSLLVYDGGSREGLLQFITHCKCTLQKLDLRLPLDLDNDHLLTVANKFHILNTLRLRSCCLVTGDGLKALVRALSYKLEEIALINCDVVERELGLLTSLSQCLKRLRKLDLSYNEMLVDKEFVSMIVSCGGLVEVKLRGCGGLGSVSLVSMTKNCKNLESVDIVNCRGIEAAAVEFLVLNLPRLRQVQVEECKLSDVAKNWVSEKFIEVVIG
ncbi:Leucine-rich repeat [Dillenia turbinata]|uniref:Leucine-rich repeat n=1 Tax=Dillenia turbinata TaxID=194707 RepID=A0AAN8UMI1_9MAGN